MPGYLPMANEGAAKDVPMEDAPASTLSKLPLADLLNVIARPGMPSSNKDRDDCYSKYGRPQTPPPHGRCVSRAVAPCAGCQGSHSNAYELNPVRPPSRGSRPNSARPSSARSSSEGSRPPSARPMSARGHDCKPDFLVAMPQGKPFSPRIEFLEPKIVGNGSQWDQDRLLQPERAYPCIARGAAEFHDRNELRENRPPWKPTIANRASGMGIQLAPSFPMPPRPLSARPRSASRQSRLPSPLRV
eukprot:TRINITY_DN1446_c0_g2_i1.p1 TRINITY_DN1446_c0_g2~~TRINITY_DN1446_c0_g2_i1.p1  ORF type:complete len:245 (-),score=6.85 TRINITY_DN1446_c0_g2_i1:425-1159(-)